METPTDHTASPRQGPGFGARAAKRVALTSNHAQTSTHNYVLNGSASETSNTSPLSLTVQAEHVGTIATVFEQQNHPRGFKRLAIQGLEVEECYEGAFIDVSGLNPSLFHMPHGTIVINLKTDYIDNVRYSVQTSFWTTLEVVSKRIMEIWNSRKHESEKVFFICAVNTSKQFCGLAEMTGPWDRGTALDGWREPTAGAGCFGAIPLTWIYVKNVRYEEFAHIHQYRSDQTVGNMWNGMPFDMDVGRQVVETYVSAPHMGNILAWEKDSRASGGRLRGGRGIGNGLRNSPLAVENVRAIRGSSINQRPPLGARRNRPALAINDWRKPAPVAASPEARSKSGSDESTPKASRNGVPVSTSYTTLPIYMNEGSAALRAGEVVSFIVGTKGELLPLPTQQSSAAPPDAREYFRQYGRQMRAHAIEVETTQDAFHGQDGGYGILNCVQPFHALPKNPYIDEQTRQRVGGLGRMHDTPHEITPPPSSRQQVHFPSPHSSGYGQLHLPSSNTSSSPEIQKGHSPYRAGAVPKAPAIGLGITYKTEDSTSTTSSYPGWMRSADSQAGYTPMYRLKKQLANVKETGTPRIEITPAHGDMQTPQEKVRIWVANTPPPTATLTIVQAVSIPIHLRSAFFLLIGEKMALEQQITRLDMVDLAGYVAIMAKVSEVDVKMRAMLYEKSDKGSSLTRSTKTGPGAHDSHSSDDNKTTYTSPSIPRQTISPFRGEDGKRLDSPFMAPTNDPYMQLIRREFGEGIHRCAHSRDSSVDAATPSSPKASNIQGDEKSIRYDRLAGDAVVEGDYDSLDEGGVSLTP